MIIDEKIIYLRLPSKDTMKKKKKKKKKGLELRGSKKYSPAPRAASIQVLSSLNASPM